MNRLWMARACLVAVAVALGGCSGSEQVRSEPDTPVDRSDFANAVGEPLAPRLRSIQAWTGTTLVSYGGWLQGSDEFDHSAVSIDVDTLLVEEQFDSPPFHPSFIGSLSILEDLVYFGGSECDVDADPDAASREVDVDYDSQSEECPRRPVLASLDPGSGAWERITLPDGEEQVRGIEVIGGTSDGRLMVTGGTAPTRLWEFRASETRWIEWPVPVLQDVSPDGAEYAMAHRCVIGTTVVLFGAERVTGTVKNELVAATLDVSHDDDATAARWATSSQEGIGQDSAEIFCGDELAAYSPSSAPNSALARFSPADRKWTPISPSPAALEGVDRVYAQLGLSGWTGREVVYPGAPGVRSMIVDVATGDWREGPPSPGMFDDVPTWVGSKLVGISATGEADQFVTPADIALPPTGALFAFDIA
jgi:hypothetical protein